MEINYKELIMDVISDINSQKLLEIIYRFAVRMKYNWG